MSLTPGVRFEYIKTSSEGSYYTQNTNLAEMVIFEDTVPTEPPILIGIPPGGYGASARYGYKQWKSGKGFKPSISITPIL